jgi:hypothetical protein
MATNRIKIKRTKAKSTGTSPYGCLKWLENGSS